MPDDETIDRTEQDLDAEVVSKALLAFAAAHDGALFFARSALGAVLASPPNFDTPAAVRTRL